MAVVDYFLKIDGITGESTDNKHKKEIDIESWSWGERNTGTAGKGGGIGAGKVQMDDMTFVMRHNVASPQLMLACASGEHIKKAVLVCRKAGKEQQEYLKITLSDLIVSSYHTGASSAGGGEAIPTDQFSINFSKIEHEYKAQKPDGSMDGPTTKGWDLAGNVKV
jgi:type VI secretion system secreted protein Hcp